MEDIEEPTLNLKIETINKEVFEQFKKDVRIFFASQEFDKKPNRIQVDILKNLMGPDLKKIYNILKDVKNNEETLNYIFSTIENYLNDKNDNLLLYEFFGRRQTPYESFSDFYSDLQRLILFCKFGDQKKKLLKAQIMLGIRSKKVRRKIIEENLCLEDIVFYCRDFERQTEENGIQLSEDEEEQITIKPDINNINNKVESGKGRNCTETYDNHFLETNQIHIKEERDPFASDEELYTPNEEPMPDISIKIEAAQFIDTNNSQNDKFFCDLCPKYFKYKSTLKNHKINVHKLKLPKLIKGKKDLTCPICQKVFANPNSFKNHEKVHTGEKDFICEICSKGFAAKSTLETHIRRHKGDPDKECEICHHKFYRNSELNVHMKRAHTDDKPYCCEICGIQLRTKIILKYHMRIHTGERPYKCDLCPKAFRISTSLRNHRRIHTGERNHVCQLCSRAFTEKGQLRTHMKTHRDRDPQEIMRALNIIKKDSRYSLVNRTINDNPLNQL